jgi:hypothetical protein
MYTSSFVLFALAGSVAASSPLEGLAWQDDYVQARKVGQTEKKPLAVFFGSGEAGYNKVCTKGQLSIELQKKLADVYVCVYVDVSTPAGQKLAADFGITKKLGLVVSDRTGELQAFYHEGDLSESDLSRWITRFADPNVVVKSTMKNTVTQVSYYPPTTNYPSAGNGYGQYYQTPFSGGRCST